MCHRGFSSGMYASNDQFVCKRSVIYVEITDSTTDLYETLCVTCNENRTVDNFCANKYGFIGKIDEHRFKDKIQFAHDFYLQNIIFSFL